MLSFFFKRRLKLKNNFAYNHYPYQADSVPSKEASSSLTHNHDFIYEALSYTNDFFKRQLTFNDKSCAIIALETLVNLEAIEKNVIKPLLQAKTGIPSEIVSSAHFETTTDLAQAVTLILEGACILLCDESNSILILKMMYTEDRNVDEPVNEPVLRGSHLGFIENLSTNIKHLRRCRNPNLKVEYIEVGKATKTKIAIVYMNHLVNPKLLKNIKSRLHAISTDFIQTPGFIEEYLEDRPFSPFPQLLNTERPDRTIANIMDGRVAVLLEGNPSALIAPSTFMVFYQSPDDYNSRWYIGSFYRIVRIISFFLAIGLPAMYIAVITYHYQVIPIELLFTIKSSIEPIPLPPILEAFAMQIILELIREAAVRLPAPISNTIGIVGGLVIGNAIVDANLVSNTMIIIVALTAIASFIVPSTEMGTAIRLLGFPLMIMAAVFGLVGIVFGLLLMLIHLCKLEVFGTPYFTPFGPLHFNGFKDSIIRLPIWMLNKRPSDARPIFKLQKSSSRPWDDKE